MLLSIISGTCNRIDLLRSMIESARKHLRGALSYQFVIVDCNSQDGTPEWCLSQSDIVFIQQGERRGAISAFTEGAYAAKGDLCLFVNDDVLFIDYSILAAIAYLQEHPSCGAVAFSDDRPAQSKPDGYHVQTMTVSNLDGNPISIPYAQVGLYRRWLGDLCGWWGANDPLFKSHTYGGDNYLTAKIIEYGYTVDAVEGVRVKDIVAHDDLRQANTRHELTTVQSGGGYYARFTSPPQMKDYPLISNPEKDSGLRILYLPIFESKVYPHHRVQKRGLREALSRMGSVIEVDYLNEEYDLVELVKAWQPDILFSQCQRDLIDLTQARAACPEMLVLNWNGDVYLDALVTPVTMAWLKANVDVQLVVNAAALSTYAENSIAAAYWQCAYEPVNGEVSISPDDAPEIVLMGSAYSEKRHELAHVLIDMPYKLHLVGSGWVNYPDFNAGNTTYNFEVSNAIRRSARIEIGDNQYASDTGFVSNRIFDCLASGGALLLHQKVLRMEEYTGLRANEHYIEWDDYDDLRQKITYWMDHRRNTKRDKIVKCAYDYVRSHHSFDARLKQLFNVILPRVL